MLKRDVLWDAGHSASEETAGVKFFLSGASLVNASSTAKAGLRYCPACITRKKTTGVPGAHLTRRVEL